jgi:uncharacterized protein YabN with tetrapyrrole methylase and pyrophosphatase domain
MGRVMVRFNEKLKEELGDVLWYISTIASQHNIKMDEIAEGNLKKINDRFSDGDLRSFKIYDDEFVKDEQFPREFEIQFIPFVEKDKSKVKIISNDGTPIGDPLSDNAYDDDGYRFHDIFSFWLCCVSWMVSSN